MCGQFFDPADRTPAGGLAANPAIYCSEKCARRAENRRAYLRKRQ